MAADPHVAMLQAALALQQKGNLKEARRKYESIIARDPRNFNALQLCGVVALQQEAYRDAVKLIRRALVLRGNDAPALTNLGIAYQKLGQVSEALECFDKAIAAKPDFASAHHNRANLLRESKRHDEAVASYDQALALQPENYLLHANRASALYDLDRLEEALAALERAIALRPDYATAHFRRAEVLLDLDRHKEAADIFETLLAKTPDEPSIKLSLAYALANLGRLTEAEAQWKGAVAHIAGADAAAIDVICEGLHRANLLPALYCSEMELREARAGLVQTLGQAQALLADFTKRSASIKAAFETLALNTSGFYIAYQQENDRKVMCLLSDIMARMLGIEERPARKGPRKPGKIRLGIASEKLYHHNGSSWAYPWLSHLPADYEFFTYAFHGIRDETSAKFAGLGTHRRLSFDATNHAKTIATMRADDLDILMLPDIGMTPSSRVLSLHRIAPIQFTAWGHPVTSGSPAMDFYLSSNLMEPEDGEDHYSEKLIRLPNLALYVTPREAMPAKQEFPLPEGRLLYGCLQSLFKYLPRYDEILPRIAAAIPKALFVFIEGQAPFMTEILRARLKAAFAAAGLSAEKHVMFLPRMGSEAFDVLTQKMDVLVDSPGWSGGNTTLTAIEAGIPMVTLPGAFMRGRHSYAMFRMMDMPSAIAADRDDFVAKLVALGRDAEARQAMRQDMQARKAALYEDQSLIAALDGFLKAEFAKL